MKIRKNNVLIIAILIMVLCILVFPCYYKPIGHHLETSAVELDEPFKVGQCTRNSANIHLGNGYGVVAPRSTICPTMGDAKGSGEWSDAKYDVVNIEGNDYFTVLSKINGTYLYVGVVIDPEYNSIAENGDSCTIVFDKNHDGGTVPGVDDWLVECKVQSFSCTMIAKKGDGAKWVGQSWPADWEVEAFDAMDTMQVYTFKINTSVVFREVSGNLIGFGVKIYEKSSGDNIYWPDTLNPPTTPENVPNSWGHLFYNRPMLLINKVSSNGTGNNEWIELYNNCSTDITIHDVIISDQDGNYSVLPNITISAHQYLILRSGSKENGSDFSGASDTIYIEGSDWWDDTGDDLLLRYGGNGCIFDYMQYGTGPEVDSHPKDPTSSSDWGQNTSNLTAPSIIQYLCRVPDGKDTNKSSDWQIFNIKTNSLDHIALTPIYEYPLAQCVKARCKISCYRAIGWNDAVETEKNYTWTPTWGTTNNLGTLVNSSGTAYFGYTIDYSAKLVPGFDNITVINISTGIINNSCIMVYGNPLDHISLKPMYEYPFANIVSVGATIVGYKATGWNDAEEKERNYTWKPVWGTTDSLGIPINFGGSAAKDYVIDYIAGMVPGFDNVTICDRIVNITNISCVRIIAGKPHQLTIVTGNDQISTAGTTLPIPFVIEVQDEFGNPVGDGVDAWFNITTAGLNGDGYLSSTNLVQTNESGCANTTLTLDTRPGLNIVTAELANLNNTQVAFTATGTLPQISPYLVINNSNVIIGAVFNYYLHYYIVSNEPATNVWINDTLSPFLIYISDNSNTTPIISGANYSWHFTSLPVGHHSFVLSCRVSTNTENGAVISNFFTVDYWDQTGKIQSRIASNTEYVTVFAEPIQNIPPVIAGVPDLVVHYDWDYNIDLSPYIIDPDNSFEELFLIFSDTYNVRVDPINNLRLILNYSIIYVGTTQVLTITVTDNLGSGWDMINVKITDNFPPEALNKIPDVTLDEDSIVYPFNITHYFFDRDGDTTYYIFGEENINVTYLQNYIVCITPKSNWYGIESVTFRAIDNTSALIEDTIEITVSPLNDPPEILSIVDQRGKINNAWILDLRPYLHDIDNDLSQLTVSTDSSYVIVNGLNLTFRYPDAVDTDIVTITVTDGDAKAYQQVYITVEDPEQSTSFDQVFTWVFIIIIIIIIIITIVLMLKNRRHPIVEDLFLIYKDGTLMAHATRRIVPDLDADIFSGMLTAIQDFVKDSFKDETDFGLKRLEFGDNKLGIERGKSGNFYLAFVYKGEGNEKKFSKIANEVIVNVEEQFGETLMDWSGKISEVRGMKDILSDAYK